jgi:DNA invertase Pin-like site-specific DNA recombinase
MASLAEYERELIRERINAGLQSARARGRPKGYTKETISKLIIMRLFYKDTTKYPEEIYKPLGLARATFYRYAKILDNNTDEETKNGSKKK